MSGGWGQGAPVVTEKRGRRKVKRAVGYFEQRARMRRLRDSLWRAVYVQDNAYRGMPENPDADQMFGEAVEDQCRLLQEAYALGFTGRPEWLSAARGRDGAR